MKTSKHFIGIFFLLSIILSLLSIQKAKGQFVEIRPEFNVTHAAGHDLDPVWSADSDRILFQSNKNGNYDIYIYQIDNDSAIQVTTENSNEQNPIWIENENSIVFDSDRSGEERLYKMDLNSGNITLLFDRDIRAREACFSASEKLVYFSGFDPLSKKWEIYSYEFYYENLNKLTDLDQMCKSPKVSPDEDKVIFTYSSSNFPFDKIQIMSWYGHERQTFTDFRSINPSWSPDGLKVYFLVVKPKNQQEIYSMWHDGSHLEQITFSGMNLKNPVISPNGNYFAVSVELADGFDIFILPAEDY